MDDLDNRTSINLFTDNKITAINYKPCQNTLDNSVYEMSKEKIKH